MTDTVILHAFRRHMIIYNGKFVMMQYKYTIIPCTRVLVFVVFRVCVLRF